MEKLYISMPYAKAEALIAVLPQGRLPALTAHRTLIVQCNNYVQGGRD